MHSQKRLVTYLSGPSLSRSNSHQQDYFTRSYLSLNNRNYPKFHNPSNNPQCHIHCCCSKQSHPYYNTTHPEEDKTTDLKQELKRERYDLKQELKRERFENKLLLKELQSKQLLKERNSDLSRMLDQKIQKLSQLQNQLDKQSRDIEILKEQNDFLNQQSGKLATKIQQQSLKVSQKQQTIAQLKASQLEGQNSLHMKFLEVQQEAKLYKEELRKLQKTHKIEEQWKKQSQLKIQGKLRSNHEISLCIDIQDNQPLNRGTQTGNIEGFKDMENINRMQDQLCLKINQNIVLEGTLFKRIRQVEEELQRGMQILFEMERKENQLQIDCLQLSQKVEERK